MPTTLTTQASECNHAAPQGDATTMRKLSSKYRLHHAFEKGLDGHDRRSAADGDGDEGGVDVVF